MLSGAVGTHPGISAEQCPNPEAALIRLRHLFDLRISVRTVRVPGEADVIIVRNITGGAYAGPEQRVESDGTRDAEDRIVLNPRRVQEVFDIGVEHARAASGPAGDERRQGQRLRHLAAVAAHLAGHRGRDTGWRSTTSTSTAPPTSWCKYEQLPAVIITEGLFGDILSDIVCARAGSPALCGSATINPDRRFGARRHRAVRAGARLVPAPHRQPALQPDRRLARARRPARLVPRPRRPRPAHHRARRARPRCSTPARPPTTWPRPGTPVLDLDQFNARVARRARGGAAHDRRRGARRSGSCTTSASSCTTSTRRRRTTSRSASGRGGSTRR